MDTNDEQYVYDLYLSVGPTCQPSENLRRNFLRDFSAPLDWMGHYSLETVLHLFRTGYDDFFKEYKIDEEREGARGDVMGNMRLVTDTLNGIDSIHHFPEFEDMDYAHRMFSDKMSERAARLERRIRSAGSVALVTRRADTKEEMMSFLRAFHDIYPHLKLLLLNFRHDDSFGFEDYEKEVVFDDGTLSYHDYLLNDTLQGKEVWFGNSYVWQKILSQYDTPETSLIRNEWKTYREQNQNLIMYGAGKGCIEALNYCFNRGIEIDGIAVRSMTDNPREINGIKVKLYTYYPKDSAIIVSLKDIKESIEAKKDLNDAGFNNIVFLREKMRLIPTV